MPRSFAAIILVLTVLAAPAGVLADYRSGIAAWGRGDYAAAARAFRAGAEAGDPESQYMLGRLYAMGDGVPQDFVQAWVWQERAARLGSEDARATRDALEQVMTPSQLAQARAQAAPVTPAPPPVAALPEAPEVGPVAPVLRTPQPGQAPGQVIVGEGARPVVILPRPAGAVPTIPVPPPTDPVRLAQRQLNRAGYFAGPVDGKIGPMTRQALRAWQQDNGLPVTGVLTAELVERLSEGSGQQVARE